MATQSRIGWRPYVLTQVVNAVDADATAFIAAAGITNLTQAAAISTLVNDLKTYGLWTKMKALYPMVGGSATSHKFNLKDPRDLDAAYRLVFNGGWVHSSTGALPNGTTGYANTFLAPNAMGQNNAHLSYYSRTNNDGLYGEIGAPSFSYYPRYNNLSYVYMNVNGGNATGYYYDSSGFFMGNRTISNIQLLFRNGVKIINAGGSISITPSTSNIFIGASNNGSNVATYFSNRESAFASIGDGLTDTEATNFYNSVQKFQTTLGRQIGSPIVSDTDAQAFLNAAAITDLGQANAVNTLVIDLKAAGVWTKMKAIYPFVGGTATTHKWNLKDPRDLDAAFRLVFNGGWVHSATGALPNGTTGYANTFLVPSNNFPISQYDAHISLYSRTNIEAPTTNWLSGSIGVDDDYNSAAYFVLNVNSKTTRIVQGRTLGNQWATYSGPLDDSRGFFIINKQNNTTLKLKKNDTLLSSNTTLSTAQYRPAQNFYIGAVNGSQSYSGLNYDNKEYSFISIGNGLTDTEATAFYTAVQKYQTSLSRQIGTPVLAAGQTAGLLDTYSGAAVAYSLRKLRTGYYGNAIRVRRSSDNSEQDIAFNADGTLDTTSLLAFVGSGNGFVTTWYDQSGNGYNAYQSTAINQPLIVSSGLLTTNGGKPAIRCVSGTGLLINQISLGTTHSMFGVIDWISGNKEYFGSFGNSWAFYQVDGEYKANGAVGRTNASFTTNRFLGTLIRVNTQLQYYQNSTTLGSPFTISSNNSFNLSNLVGEDYNWGFAGDQQEAIIYTSSMASSRIGIENNINTYYSIY